MTNLPSTVLDRIAPHTGSVRTAQPVGGGCIANATRLDTDQGQFFLKWARGEAGQTFEAEAAGLRALAAANSSLLVPQPMLSADGSGEIAGLLLMEWIEPGPTDAAYWEALGEGLAGLHRSDVADDRFGFGVDNFIGRTPQSNTWHADWAAFFRAERLEPQIALAHEQNRWRSSWTPLAEGLLDRLPELLPASPPVSVLHGDLWSGNVLAAENGRAALIDPATYYGHREADLALTELFGGFGAVFYESYRAAWPLEPGYEERREIYNLYHLLNHLNLFGGSYAAGVERTLRRFG